MLNTIVAGLIILWLLGHTSGYTLGGMLHFLLAAALVTVLSKLTSGPEGRDIPALLPEPLAGRQQPTPRPAGQSSR